MQKQNNSIKEKTSVHGPAPSVDIKDWVWSTLTLQLLVLCDYTLIKTRLWILFHFHQQIPPNPTHWTFKLDSASIVHHDLFQMSAYIYTYIIVKNCITRIVKHRLPLQTSVSCWKYLGTPLKDESQATSYPGQIHVFFQQTNPANGRWRYLLTSGWNYT